ncbi:uncharacterized protein LOC134781657 isoform X2 [Penaeus indicus]|uniref:uncharacterized protein LOC134781657 isoform X2 n=1 Tax=Penaeus indicus TaxID=29960 RepID=UPI00300CA73F
MKVFLALCLLAVVAAVIAAPSGPAVLVPHVSPIAHNESSITTSAHDSEDHEEPASTDEDEHVFGGSRHTVVGSVASSPVRGVFGSRPTRTVTLEANRPVAGGPAVLVPHVSPIAHNESSVTASAHDSEDHEEPASTDEDEHVFGGSRHTVVGSVASSPVRGVFGSRPTRTVTLEANRPVAGGPAVLVPHVSPIAHNESSVTASAHDSEDHEEPASTEEDEHVSGGSRHTVVGSVASSPIRGVFGSRPTRTVTLEANRPVAGGPAVLVPHVSPIAHNESSVTASAHDSEDHEEPASTEEDEHVSGGSRHTVVGSVASSPIRGVFGSRPTRSVTLEANHPVAGHAASSSHDETTSSSAILRPHRQETTTRRGIPIPVILGEDGKPIAQAQVGHPSLTAVARGNAHDTEAVTEHNEEARESSEDEDSEHNSQVSHN